MQGPQGQMTGYPQVFTLVREMPPRVNAAFRALSTIHQMRVIPSVFDGGQPDMRDMISAEKQLYLASLDTLRLYVTGEMDFAEPPPPIFMQPPPDPPMAMQPQPPLPPPPPQMPPNQPPSD